MAGKAKKPGWTPGPWEVGGRGTTIRLGDRGYAGVDHNEGVPFVEALANARLIAESPELAEVLRQAVAWVEEYFGEGDDLNGVRWRRKALKVLGRLDL